MIDQSRVEADGGGGMTALYTTYALAERHGACSEALQWAGPWLAEQGRGLDDPVELIEILDHAPPADAQCWALWALSAVPPEQEAERDRLARLYVADCAERVLPLWAARYPDDARPAVAIDTARRYARGEATEGERDAAWDAAGAAAWDTAGDAAWAAAWELAGDAAWATAWAAAWAAARAAAWAAARAAARDAAGAAAGAAAWDAARAAAGDAEREWQTARLRLYLTGADLPPVEMSDAAGERVE